MLDKQTRDMGSLTFPSEGENRHHTNTVTVVPRWLPGDPQTVCEPGDPEMAYEPGVPAMVCEPDGPEIVCETGTRWCVKPGGPEMKAARRAG
jgi:hypothetical protein